MRSYLEKSSLLVVCIKKGQKKKTADRQCAVDYWWVWIMDVLVQVTAS